MTTTLDAEWRLLAACRGTDQPEVFFPEPGMVATDGRMVCAGCSVTAECLAYALDTRQQFGVWGGTSAKERKRMLRCRDGICQHESCKGAS